VGCGTCQVICPVGAILMRETPGGLLVAQVDLEKCTSCARCRSVCPGTLLEPGLMPDGTDPFTGSVLRAYVAQARDTDVLHGAQSGGAVSGLLCHLLQSGMIDGALVTAMPRDGSLRPRACVATTRDELLQARGSKYCPVAVNLALDKDGCANGRQIAFVGLPCHVHGLRNLQIHSPEKTRGVRIVIGLVCAGVLSYHAIDHLIHQSGLDTDHALDIQYRSKGRNGWPGDVRVRSEDGTEYWVPAEKRHRCKPVFEAFPCRLCFDQMNVLSDVVVGDPWGVRETKEGHSVVIARTEAGLNAVLSAERAGALTLEPVAPEDVFAGQTVDTRHRRDWTAFTTAWQRMGNVVPDFGIQREWWADIAHIDLAPYRTRLLRAWDLWNARDKNTAQKTAARRLQLLRVRSALSPKRVARFVARGMWRFLTRPGKRRSKSSVRSIVMFGAHFTGNLGGPSVILGTIKALSRYLPNARYALLRGGNSGAAERAIASQYGIDVIEVSRLGKSALASALLWRLFGVTVGFSAAVQIIRSLLRAHVVVDVSGIAFADTLGTNTLRSRMREKPYWLLAKLLGKRVVKYTSAFGPCRHKWNRRFAKFYLGRCCDVVLARDPQSLREIRRIGVRTEGMVCPDSGFLLDAVSSDVSRRLSSLRNTRPVVGVSVSYRVQLHAASPDAYVSAMVQLIHRIIEVHHAYVVIIPNEVSDGPFDDMKVAERISSEVGLPDCEVVKANELRAEEIKGIIGECDAVVAARYHTIIAAISLGVPVLAISWHHKYVEALRLVGQQDQVCDIRDASPEKIIAMFESMWQDREKAREVILSRMPAVCEGIDAGARRTAAVLDGLHAVERELHEPR